MNGLVDHIESPGTLVNSKLRILATSDLHMHLTGFNYVEETRNEFKGLSKIATLIETARADLDLGASILLDNGDALQGSSLTEVIGPDKTLHPMAEAFNTLAYDAIGLGNHDFDFGLPYLDQVTQQYRAPVIASNLENAGLSAVAPSVILERSAICSDGETRALRIGILSVLPEQTLQWNSAQVPPRVKINEMVSTALTGAKQLKREGADIVVLLAHSGLGTSDPPPGSENNALRMGAITEIDAVIAGHTHHVFASPDHPATPEAQDRKATDLTRPLAPTVMPGCCATHLAQIDLSLVNDGCGWHVTQATSHLYPVSKAVIEHPEIIRLAHPAHTKTRAKMKAAIGRISQPVNSYFNMVQSSPDMRLCAAAMKAATKAKIATSPFADLPVLTAIAPVASGGLGGPSNYLELPDGRVAFRHIRQLCQHENMIWGVPVTGAQVHEWLERAAVVFNQLEPDCPDQPLLNATRPRYNFDQISEMSYTLDITQPAKYDCSGRIKHPTARRVRNLTWQGRSLELDQEFLMLNTSYRLSGGGNFPGVPSRRPLWQSTISLQDALIGYLAQNARARIPVGGHWAIETTQNRQAIFETSPHARSVLGDLESYHPEALAQNGAGFLEVRLRF